ncbi:MULTISPECIES: O-methyltransferase [Bacillus]|uniref:Methyltransferase n=2 Tax=Bacillus TaxID=1386 RepID=A0A0M5JEY6_9BACI|nr:MULTISPECIES: O-methyltransferase [Bacillus]ALC83494.1 methyltransferase [Bacillus gobiensis]MBP1082460.1 putative O-methyltransferase YrrM [Bacillus capparidis]MED1097296.1 O-methyltransferase [Bacillus capparidis]
MDARKTWVEVDQYITEKLLSTDAILDAVLDANAAAGLPAIDVSPNQGKLLHLLAKLRGARNVLEIGTLGGYSTIWLARALPKNGRVITLEANQKHAEVAKKNLELAGLSQQVEVVVGPALDTLPTLRAKGHGVFDVIFIDADKPNNPHYLKWALELSAEGTLIIGDNVVREGEVVNQDSSDERVQGTRQFFDLLSAETRIDATALQTVGSKGYDGFVLGVVTDGEKKQEGK